MYSTCTISLEQILHDQETTNLMYFFLVVRNVLCSLCCLIGLTRKRFWLDMYCNIPQCDVLTWMLENTERGTLEHSYIITNICLWKVHLYIVFKGKLRQNKSLSWPWNGFPLFHVPLVQSQFVTVTANHSTAQQQQHYWYNLPPVK
jgi:hypothetical protein